MRCPRTDFRCCVVFSAGSNPDFDLCATVRDFHPCFPRPTDWLKCEKEQTRPRWSQGVTKCILIFEYVDMSCQPSNRKKFPEKTKRACASRPCRHSHPPQIPEILPEGKKMPTLPLPRLRLGGTFFQFPRFFRLHKTWHGVCLITHCSETTHGLGHNQ